MSKFVHGRVRLATASPRVGEYDYATRSYEPADYYGDHFMYRDDPNLLPVRQGLYASYSPTPSQNALTAFPPPMLVDRHGNSYSNWSPAQNMGASYLSGSYLGNPTDGEQAAADAGAQIAAAIAEGEEEVVEEPAWWEQLGQGIYDAWNSLSDEQKEQFIEEGLDYAMGGDAEAGVSALGLVAASQLSDSQLKDAYRKAKNKQSPYSPIILGDNYNPIYSSLIGEMFKRGFLTLQIDSSRVKGWIRRQVNLTDLTRPQWCPAFPNHPLCKPKQKTGTGTGTEKKTGVGGLILGAGALALLASLL